MGWKAEFYQDFASEYKKLPLEVQKKIAEYIILLMDKGSNLGRPVVDTLYGSKFPNMKELRYDSNQGSWRVAFAFDPTRRAILLVAGDKSNDKKFYKKLIKKADQRYTDHLEKIIIGK